MHSAIVKTYWEVSASLVSWMIPANDTNFSLFAQVTYSTNIQWVYLRLTALRTKDSDTLCILTKAQWAWLSQHSHCNAILDSIPSEQAMLWSVMLKGWKLQRLFGRGLNAKHDCWVGVNPSPVPATVCASVLWFWETRVAFFIQPAFILCPIYVSVNRGLNQGGINNKMILPLEIRG
jgi:hypothetical protein